jgi:hypothetical protein
MPQRSQFLPAPCDAAWLSCLATCRD